ncbi:hypothetical protein [Bradyrhizobium sp. NBAIM01]|uniref:hypothetical protein n=1 Tax=Bradyrhizobium sp. NBAIM01 TaxID=2793818 RepID=UPI001CD7586C|nr:hypothetical protein [Bradyrhizobium sp. NBAIM01]MCA1510280.1 hypothetical protein [Bradyrhizobium sp. NBAIM01]
MLIAVSVQEHSLVVVLANAKTSGALFGTLVPASSRLFAQLAAEGLNSPIDADWFLQCCTELTAIR